jgi:hypothetical protein
MKSGISSWNADSYRNADSYQEEIIMIQLDHPYQTRAARFLELWEWQGWRIKVYGLATQSEYPAEALVQAAKEIAQQRLPQPAISDHHYGLAYMIVHEGETGDYVIVDWWFDQDIVQHHLYGAPKGHNGALQYHWPPGAGFCVWELAICWFERQAWVETILSKPEAPDIEAYLMKRLNADV